MSDAAPDHAPLCAPPDREPRPPRTAFPPLACDTHAHIFEARFPYAQERIYTPPDSNLDDYKKLLKTLGCQRAVLVQPSVYGADNAAMLDALERGGPGFRAVAVTDSGHRAKGRSTRCTAPACAVCVSTWSTSATTKTKFPPACCAASPSASRRSAGTSRCWSTSTKPAISRRCSARSACRWCSAISAIPRAAPRHGPQTRAFADLLRLIDGGQCWIKLTGPYRITTAPDLPYADVDEPARKLVAAAPERMIWGTDWPHVMKKKPMRNDGDMADLLERWVPDAALRRRVLVDNPAELYGFEAARRLCSDAWTPARAALRLMS